MFIHKHITALKNVIVLAVASAIVVPSITSAANVENLGGLIRLLASFINPIAAIITGLAFIFFLWGIAKYIFSAGDENKKQEGKSIMLWGIIGLFVMFSIWGILTILFNTFFEGIPKSIQFN